MSRSMLVVLFLVGCAGNQSAFPAPPPFNPAMDAPITIGHPGTVAPRKPERSPHKRVLPQTPETRREDGLWASDGEPLGRSLPLLLGQPVPFPPDGTNDQRLDALANACATTMNSAAEGAGIASFLRVVPDEARLCLSMQLYHYCLFWTVKGEDVDDTTRRRIDAFIQHVREKLRAACNGVPRPSFEGVYNPIAAEWRRRHVKDSGTFGL